MSTRFVGGVPEQLGSASSYYNLRARVADRRPGRLADGRDRCLDLGVHPDGDGEERPGPAHRASTSKGRGVERQPARATSVPLQPPLRAVATDAMANDAAPRAEAALPPRSRVAAITGAATGVLIVAASAFRPRTSRCLPWILVWPNAAPCFLCPQTRFCIESMSTNATASLPGSSGRGGPGPPAAAGSPSPPAARCPR